MFRVTDLIDLPISAVNEKQKENYTVKSVLFDGINNKIAAFVCKGGSAKKYTYILPYESVISVDINKIVIPDYSNIRKIPSKDLNNYIQLDNVLNKLVKSNTGDLHGIITDIYINLLNGKITAFELSEGYIDDIVRGRKVFQMQDPLQKNLVNDEIVVYQRLN